MSQADNIPKELQIDHVVPTTLKINMILKVQVIKIAYQFQEHDIIVAFDALVASTDHKNNILRRLLIVADLQMLPILNYHS